MTSTGIALFAEEHTGTPPYFCSVYLGDDMVTNEPHEPVSARAPGGPFALAIVFAAGLQSFFCFGVTYSSLSCALHFRGN